MGGGWFILFNLKILTIALIICWSGYGPRTLNTLSWGTGYPDVTAFYYMKDVKWV